MLQSWRARPSCSSRWAPSPARTIGAFTLGTYGFEEDVSPADAGAAIRIAEALVATLPP